MIEYLMNRTIKKLFNGSISTSSLLNSWPSVCRYLFADLYAGAIWAGAESPVDSGKFGSSKVSFACARDSPMSCTATPGSSLPALSYIFSFGEDSNKDVYILTNSGVYRVVRPSRCGYSCAKEDTSSAAAAPPPAASPPPSRGGVMRAPCEALVALALFLYFVCMN